MHGLSSGCTLLTSRSAIIESDPVSVPADQEETLVSEADTRCDHHDDSGAHVPHAPLAASDSDHDHDHAHGHKTRRAESRTRLMIVLGLTSALMLVEVIAGIYTHSLALMADAGHMLSDVASQGLALLAIWFAAKPPTPGKSYGYYRTEILASLINGVALVGISILILFEAVHRLANPPEVQGGAMLVVAIIGLAINMTSMRVLHSVADHSLNVKAAYLELLGDLLASVESWSRRLSSLLPTGIWRIH